MLLAIHDTGAVVLAIGSVSLFVLACLLVLGMCVAAGDADRLSERALAARTVDDDLADLDWAFPRGERLP